MNIGIIGQGFVGTAVFSHMQKFFNVFAFDKDPTKFSNVSGLSELVEKVDITFLCVPTPMKKNGDCDLGIIKSALREITDCVQRMKKKDFVVVLKSTVLPGSTEKLNQEFEGVSIVFNPEFLTEANSVEDYKRQNRIIIGGPRTATTKVKVIFEKSFPQVPIIKTSSTIAEMVKYVTNTFLATKVSFANEMHQICEGLDIDYDKVIEYAKIDHRLGVSHWSVPGPDGDRGFGGHCFPKDISALEFLAKELGVETTVLSAVIKKNNEVRTDRDWEKQLGRAISIEEEGE